MNSDNIKEELIRFEIVEIEQEQQERKPLLEKFLMDGLQDTAQVIYNEIVQWGMADNSGASKLCGEIYNLGLLASDMPYHGWVGERGRKEREKINALKGAYWCLLATVEDLIGIKKKEKDDRLNENGEIRYQIIDTKRN